ncbi:fumarylacetoacetate hydrolase family protein [Actinomadura fibrosa]|uniref:Fumarylacetoacetate hydrolase family protein n=1 Tax=Actinomadura fibrosa TaxID=111802 RepID=A0ABW2XTM6_9ACTN|nr:fumarylacetoacetate hydrolase family protein [Actinomadura fibrosa]
MKLVGARLPGEDAVHIARCDGGGDDARIHPITDVDQFWADAQRWTAKAAELTGEGMPAGTVRLVPPVPSSARVICIGLNYKAHAAEGSFQVPDHPTLFGRWTASLSVGGVPAPVPAGEAGLDWEGEVAAYVGAPLCDADPDTARAAVLGYSTFNDLTSRRAQKLTSQWTLGKNGDRSGPLGPLVTADEVGDLRDGLRVRTRVNGETVQDGDTRDMIFELGAVLSLISRTLTLRPGDVIATGTPEGVGYVRNPPWLLGPGDVVEVEVDRLGVLRTPIVGAAGRTESGEA